MSGAQALGDRLHQKKNTFPVYVLSIQVAPSHVLLKVCILFFFFGYDQFLLKSALLYIDMGRGMFWGMILFYLNFYLNFAFGGISYFILCDLGFYLVIPPYEWRPSIHLTLECFKRGQMEAWFMLSWGFPNLDYLWKFFNTHGAQSLID